MYTLLNTDIGTPYSAKRPQILGTRQKFGTRFSQPASLI